MINNDSPLSANKEILLVSLLQIGKIPGCFILPVSVHDIFEFPLLTDPFELEFLGGSCLENFQSLFHSFCSSLLYLNLLFSLFPLCSKPLLFGSSNSLDCCLIYGSVLDRHIDLDDVSDSVVVLRVCPDEHFDVLWLGVLGKLVVLGDDYVSSGVDTRSDQSVTVGQQFHVRGNRQQGLIFKCPFELLPCWDLIRRYVSQLVVLVWVVHRWHVLQMHWEPRQLQGCVYFHWLRAVVFQEVLVHQHSLRSGYSLFHLSCWD